MKTYTEFSNRIKTLHKEGWFSKKDPKKEKLDDLRDTIRILANKMAGKGGFGKGDQAKYNKTWIEYRKLNDGTPPRGPKPSVYYDQMKMDLWKHDKLNKEYHKKLGIK